MEKAINENFQSIRKMPSTQRNRTKQQGNMRYGQPVSANPWRSSKDLPSTIQQTKNTSSLLYTTNSSVLHTAGTKSIAGCKQALPRDEGGARTRTDAPHSRRPVQDIGTVCTDFDALYSYLLSVASKISVPANGPRYVNCVHGYFRQI